MNNNHSLRIYALHIVEYKSGSYPSEYWEYFQSKEDALTFADSQFTEDDNYAVSLNVIYWTRNKVANTKLLQSLHTGRGLSRWLDELARKYHIN